MSVASPLIAVVDDEEAVRIAFGRLLRAASFDVELFPSGAEFLESLRTHHPSCVVLDLLMLGIEGFTVQTRIVEMGIRLPVVAITGHDSAETRDRALASGVSAYLWKPVDSEVLLDAITTAMRVPLLGSRRLIPAVGPGYADSCKIALIVGHNFGFSQRFAFRNKSRASGHRRSFAASSQDSDSVASSMFFRLGAAEAIGCQAEAGVMRTSIIRSNYLGRFGEGVPGHRKRL